MVSFYIQCIHFQRFGCVLLVTDHVPVQVTELRAPRSFFFFKLVVFRPHLKQSIRCQTAPSGDTKCFTQLFFPRICWYVKSVKFLVSLPFVVKSFMSFAPVTTPNNSLCTDHTLGYTTGLLHHCSKVKSGKIQLLINCSGKFPKMENYMWKVKDIPSASKLHISSANICT